MLNLQKATVTGERMRETEGDRAASQACNIRCSYLMLCCFVVFMMFRWFVNSCCRHKLRKASLWWIYQGKCCQQYMLSTNWCDWPLIRSDILHLFLSTFSSLAYIIGIIRKVHVVNKSPEQVPKTLGAHDLLDEVRWGEELQGPAATRWVCICMCICIWRRTARASWNRLRG